MLIIFHKIKAVWAVFIRLEKIALAGAILILFLSLFFWTSIILNGKFKEIPVAGGEYREGIIGQPIYINPIIADNDADRDLTAIIYADLTALIQTPPINEGNRVYIINLKDDIYWSDGERITSDDLIFTLKTVQDPDARSPLFQTWQGVIAERISELQTRFTLKAPYVFFENNLNHLKIVPRHIFGDIPAGNLRLSSYNLEPVASGPYKFSRYEKKKNGFINEYQLAINERWSGTKPLIEKIIFKFYNNEDALINGFNLKTIDGFGGLNPLKINELNINHRIKNLILPRYYSIFFNQSVNPSLKEKTLRLALAQAINKKRIIKEIFNNSALESDGPLMIGVQGYDRDSYQKTEYSPEKAAENIKAFTADKKNILEFNLVTPQIPFLVKTAELIKNDWEAIGVKTNLIILNPDDIANEVIKTRNYEMLIFGTIVSENPDLFSFWHSSERFYPGLNLSLFNNKKIDELLEKIRQTASLEERQTYLSRFQKIIAEESPAIFLYSPQYLYVKIPSLDGFEKTFINAPSNKFQDIEKWFKKTAKILK